MANHNKLTAQPCLLEHGGKLGAKSNRTARSVDWSHYEKWFATHSTMSLGCTEHARVTTNLHDSQQASIRLGYPLQHTDFALYAIL
jgi:hypothetical protein